MIQQNRFPTATSSNSQTPGVDASHRCRALVLWVLGLASLLPRAALAQPAPPATVYTTTTSPLPDNSVTALCYDAPRARLWVGTDFGLARLDLGAGGAPVWTVYHASPTGLPADDIRAVALADASGTAVWVGTFRGGLARLDVATGAWQRWSAATSPLPLDDVRSLAPEPDGGVWVGTAGGLAHRSAGGAWQVLTPFNSALPSGNVAALARDAVDSTLWIGTVNGGLARLRRGALRPYSLRADRLPDNTVLSLVLDSARRPLLGTAAAGLVRYLTDSTWAAYGPLTSANPAATVLAVAYDSLGQRWLGSAEHGLVGWGAAGFTTFAYRSAAGLPDSTVRAIAAGATGELWLGLRSGGLARWRPGQLLSRREELTTDGIAVWPNPVGVGRTVRVRLPDGGTAVWVFDVLGRLVWEGEGRGEITLPVLRPGVYAVRVGEDGRGARRLVVE